MCAMLISAASPHGARLWAILIKTQNGIKKTQSVTATEVTIEMRCSFADETLSSLLENRKARALQC